MTDPVGIVLRGIIFVCLFIMAFGLCFGGKRL